MRKLGSLLPLVLLGLLATQGVAVPAPTSTLLLDPVAVGSNLTIGGTLELGDDATGSVVLGTDGSGDARPPALGLDVGDATVTPNLAGKKLTLKVRVNDGIPGLDGITPAAGYVWPIAFNGTDNNVWLAAGTLVSGWLPKTEKWWEVCSTSAGSYTCGNPVPGTMTATEVSWTIPFVGPGYTATYGSTLEPGAAAPGTPGTIPWAVVSGGTTFDTLGSGLLSYKIPGRVDVGIAPAGTPEENVQYNLGASFVPATGKFALNAPKPAPGSYTVFARSCFGLAEELTCVTATSPLTV